ncbi:MAG: hypothetical protein GF308_17225 [Candidatus Heimdallarchaeota archaeon]|nr:hypothetical protein [Candidatus Heimdallarchaeota archaeon]
MVTTKITLEELKPKFLDQDERYNNWYFAADFNHEGTDYNLKLSITEGSLLGQQSFISLSWDLPEIVQETDAVVLKKPEHDINLVMDEDEVDFIEEEDRFVVEMGDLKAICKPTERRIISKNEQVSLDLTFYPRGPIFYWGKEKGALCRVTEETYVAGIESLSNVKGTITVKGKKMEIGGKGLFERVWFGKLNFFQIRIMNWCYANFDELYTYVCLCESDDNESRPFHFETGKVYLKEEDEYLFAKNTEITPESWVFLEEARRFIPWEQTVVVQTDKGKLKLKIIPRSYPQLIQPPTRLEAFIVDNIPGWNSLFYDLPVTLEGYFQFNDGRRLELNNGKGINEIIRIVPL